MWTAESGPGTAGAQSVLAVVARCGENIKDNEAVRSQDLFWSRALSLHCPSKYRPVSERIRDLVVVCLLCLLESGGMKLKKIRR